VARFSAFAFGVVLLGVLLGVASLGTMFGIGACVAAAGLVAVLAVGPERLGHVMVVAAMFTAPMNDVRPSSSVSLVTFSDLFFVLGIGLLLPRILHNRVKFPSMYLGGVAILLTSGLIASILAADQLVSLNGLSRLVAACIALPAAITWWNPGQRTVDVMAGAYVAGMVVSTADALIEGPLDNDRYVGLTTHPNFFGLSGLLSLALLMYLLDRVPSNRHWILYAAGAICLVGVVESGSRAALLVFAVLVVMYPLVERSAMAGYGILVAGGLMVVLGSWLLAAAGNGSALSRLKGDSTSTYSDNQRSSLLESGFQQFLHKPFLGWGFTETPLASHNVYLEVAIAVGVVGLLGWLMLIWSLVRPLFDTALPRHRLAYPALGFALVGLLTNGIWDRFVWAAVALALLADPIRAGGPEEPPDGSAEEPQQFVPTLVRVT
jgi:O-antigen ligase